MLPMLLLLPAALSWSSSPHLYTSPDVFRSLQNQRPPFTMNATVNTWSYSRNIWFNRFLEDGDVPGLLAETQRSNQAAHLLLTVGPF